MSVRFLMYHGVYDSEDEIYGGNREWIHKTMFEEHCMVLKDGGYNVLTMDNYYQCKQNGAFPEKSVVISFDDGPLCQLKHAVPILLKYNFKAIFYIPVLKLNQTDRMTNEQVIELSKAGMEIGSHSMSHRDFRLLNKDEIVEELVESKNYLENLTGKPVTHFSFPFGYGYKIDPQIFKQSGYLTAVTVDRGINKIKTNLFTLYRLGIYNHTNKKNFLKLLNQKVFIKYYFLRYLGFSIEKIIGYELKQKLFNKIHSIVQQI